MLAKHVKVEILEGPAKGEVHKYTYTAFKGSSPASSETPAPTTAESSGAPVSAPAPASLPVVDEPESPMNVDSIDVSALWGDNEF